MEVLIFETITSCLFWRGLTLTWPTVRWANVGERRQSRHQKTNVEQTLGRSESVFKRCTDVCKQYEIQQSELQRWHNLVMIGAT